MTSLLARRTEIVEDGLGPLVKYRTPLALVLLLAAAPLAARHEDPPERVRISTLVTDRQGKPVTGLALKDFELREDGVVQKLIAVEARRPEPRRIAIVLDEFHIGPDDAARVREAVGRFVGDHVRPDDTLLVLKPLDPLTKINLAASRQRAADAIASFEGRKGQYAPRNALEAETMGTAPGLVEAGRAQVVLSALRALATQLGATPGRSAIFLVSEGFAQHPRRFSMRGLPDAGIVERFANRYDVPIYAFDPRAGLTDKDVPAVIVGRLVSETGGTLARGEDLARHLARAAQEMDSGYTLTYEPSHGGDGKYHPVAVTVVRREADARSRTGYVSPPSAAMRRAMRDLAGSGPVLSTRLLRRSPLIDVWSGVTRVNSGNGRVMVTWEPGRRFTSAAKASASRVELKATTKDGKLLFEGMLAPVRVGEAGDLAMPDRAEFDAPSGRVQLDMTILGFQGEKLDVDARDVEVPALKGTAPVLLPAILIATQSAREFRAVSADANAAPDPSRQFRRTERLVIRVPAYAGGAPVPVTARLLNRLAQTMRTIDALPGDAGVTQFDLPLAPLAPGDYFLLFTVKGPSGPVDQRISFTITG
jgi:VWFA-related protein